MSSEKNFESSYQEAWKLLNKNLSDKVVSKPPSFFKKRDLLRSIELFEFCLRINPKNWACFFGIGKAYHQLNEHEKALEGFKKACDFEKSNPDLPREASIEASILKDFDESIFYGEEALNRSPLDSNLTANLALSYYLKGNLEKAKELAEFACNQDKNDKNLMILKKIEGE